MNKTLIKTNINIYIDFHWIKHNTYIGDAGDICNMNVAVIVSERLFAITKEMWNNGYNIRV